ncbi:MAG: hypothetical protein ACK5Q1_02370 [Limnobacter sp.]|jgi:outer membrane biogenesis lipoprotein LolB
MKIFLLCITSLFLLACSEQGNGKDEKSEKENKESQYGGAKLTKSPPLPL